MSELVLYHAWSSSASRKVRLCLAEKGLDYDGRVLDLLRFQHHANWYKALNPGGIVPCLIVDGRPLVESNFINEFLDDFVSEPALMPGDPFARHEIRRFAKFVDDVCLPAVQKPNWIKTMHPLAREWSDDELQRRLAAIPSQVRRDLWWRMARDPFTREEIDAALDILEDMCGQLEAYLQHSGGPWLFGEQLTLADIAAAPYVVRFDEERPGRLRERTARWWQTFTARPAWAIADIRSYDEDSLRSRRDAIDDPPDANR